MHKISIDLDSFRQFFMANFWEKLKNSNKPIYTLAPMAGFTDSAFRQMCKKFGADVVYSEMASATALTYAPKKTLEMLKFFEIERPYVVQLFGAEPKHFAKAIKIIARQIKPDGIDINFGCPVKKVQKQGAGAVLMNNPKLAREIIKRTVGIARELSVRLPVSIKCRIAGNFLENINDLDVAAVMIHGRTMKQGFSGPVDTEIIKKARDYFGGIILANGGVYSHEDGIKLLEATQADGLGIARGALGRPWIFKALRTGQSVVRSPRAVFKEAIEHAELAFESKGEQGIIELRKHLCAYVQGLPGAREMRKKLVEVKTIKDIREIFSSKDW